MHLAIRSFFLLLCCISAASASVRISEFMAENDGLLRDQDGDTPDWIEIQNTSGSAINLNGWYLTDDAANLTNWAFPGVSIAPGGFLLVFASGKNRSNPGAELHTNFQLDNNGEYLALVRPDGVTIAHEFAPRFPPQHANVSYGFEPSGGATTLIARESPAKVLVPPDGSFGSSWTAPAFNDSSWLSATTAVGFATSETNTTANIVLSLDMNRRGSDPATTTMPGFSVFQIDGSGIVTNPTVRTYGGISVTLSNTAGFGYDDRVSTLPTNNAGFTESLLLRDYIYSRSRTNEGGLDLAIEGMVPNNAYAITVWSFDPNSPGQRVSDWYANGTLVKENYTFNGQVAPTSNSQYRFTFETVSDASGRIVVSARRDPTSVGTTGAADYGVFLNGLQVVELNYNSFLRTSLASTMRGVNASAYVRVPFTVTDAIGMNQFRLQMKYNDGFIAYLNGQMLASINAPSSPSWNATATAVHGGTATLISQVFTIDAPDLLRAGVNVLAIQGLNVSANDNDFLILPELDGLRLYSFFAVPTPGQPNRTGAVGVVSDTRFSINRGFYDTPFSLAIATATEGAAIWYTLNGSKPSPTNGFLYSAPIHITNTAFVRAAAYKSGYIPSDVDTHSYVFLDSVLRQPNTQPGYPTVWQASYPADYGMDSNIVNHPVYGATIKNDLRSIPSLCIVSDHNGLWNSSTGIYPNSTSTSTNNAWEREASAELISGAGETEFAVRCGVEMHGNASRDNVRTPKHSMRITFKHEYGPTKLRYDWFGGGVDVHDGIVLRSCGFVDGWAGRYADTNLYTSSETGEVFRGLRYRPENTCYLRDVWTKDSFRDMGWSASRSAYVHLYINGLYWGLYQPSERLTASYFETLYGGPEGAWDVLVGDDTTGEPVVVDGSATDWQTVLNIVNGGITNEARYQAVAQLVDLDNLIDYMLLHIFAESEDWPRHNWYVAHRRATNGVPGTKFICSVWDQELTLDRLVRRNRIEVGISGAEVYGPGRVYAQLRAWPEFRRQFGDRVQKHLFNGGALIPSNNIARFLAPAAIIRDALVGESARWGDARKTAVPNNQQVGTGVTFTRDEWWQPEIDKLVTNFFRKLTADNVARFRAGNLFPTLNAPVFSQFGGPVSDAFALTMTHSNAAGTIFFTIDGSDPRTYGTGQVAPSAAAYSEPITFNRPTIVRARVVNGSAWSPLVEASFYPPQDLSHLALTEIMYNPPSVGATNGEDFEFLELKNAGTNTVNLSGCVISGIGFTFSNGTVVLPGQFCVLVRNPIAFAAKYPGVAFQDVYSGRLDNGGERLLLISPNAGIVFSVAYEDEAPWPIASDSYGFSIVPRHGGLTQAPDNGANWRASSLPGGSPGADDPAPAVPPIFINEVLSASVPPEVDVIELFNPNPVPVDISGWFLTDTPGNPRKFRIPDGTILPAGAYIPFDESHFNPAPGVDPSFALSSTGEQIYLFSAETNGNLTGFTHGFAFGAADPGVPFGRYVNSAGEEDFPAQLARSFGATNQGPRIGPVVINELHYHPAFGEDEFIELYNTTPAAISLKDWRFDGLGLVFPSATTIGPLSYLLLVPIDAAVFRLRYAVPNDMPVIGPYSGVLQDSGERLKLQHPGTADTNGIVPYITVDEVRYNDRAPWPPAPDGSGPSLARRYPPDYANDPINWMSAVPTPGRSNLADSDGDGLPDEWESLYGVSDSDEDADGDGVTNLQEYRAGTDPTNSTSFLQIDTVTFSAGRVTLEFTALANRTYSILSKPQLDASAWSKFRDVPVASADRIIRLFDTTPTNQTRFYRLVTPATPFNEDPPD